MSDEPGVLDPHPAASGRHPSSLPGQAARRRRSRWLVLAAVAAAVGLLASLFAFGLGRNPDVVQPVIVGRAAPAFDLQPMGGGAPMSLASLRGQVVVLNFWASWCADCRLEQSALAQTWTAFRDQGAVVVGVSFEDSRSQAMSYAAATRTTWPLLDDPGSRTALAYGVAGVPETFVIAPNGRIAAKFTGPVSYPLLSDTVQQLLPSNG